GEMVAPGVDEIERGGRAEIDDDERRPVFLDGRHRIDDAVGADFPRVFVADVEARLDSRPDDERLPADVGSAHRFDDRHDGRHDGGDDDAFDGFLPDAGVLEQIVHQDAVFIHRGRPGRGKPPMVQQLPVFVGSDHDVRVADVDDENHAQSPRSRRLALMSPRSRLMSTARTEWVRLHAEMTSTPVSAMARTVSRRTPPDASTIVRGDRPLMSRTASRISSSGMLSSMMMSAPASRASSTWASVSVSTSTVIVWGIAARARATAARMPPAALMWLSLIMTASDRPNRWLCPPPIRTAYFSRKRWPGVVLRVSTIRTPGKSRTASTNRRVAVAMPLIRCSRLS